MNIPLEQLRLPPDFIGFNPHGAFRNYERNLPHWRQSGAAYFLTFRLADSLPAGVLAEIQQQQEAWRGRIEHERKIGGGVLSLDTGEAYEAFQTTICRRVEALMDEGRGRAVLKRPEIREIVSDAVRSAWLRDHA